MSNKTYNAADLRHFLYEMDLKGTETILVHSSMKSIGKVEGGADTVLDVFSDYFKNGLLVFPTFSFATICPTNNVFYVDKTPVCTGILPELFRHRKGVIRSLHPTHSLSALGKGAAEFTSGHEKLDTIYQMAGPFGKLLECKSKILLIGVKLNRATIIHAIEEWAEIPILAPEPLTLYVVDLNGVRHEVNNYCHLGMQWELFVRATDILLEQKAMEKVKFGDADSLLMDCEKTYLVLDKILREDPHFFYNDECPESKQMP